MKAVVMAGGEGARLRPLTSTQPKPLIRIMGRSVLGYILALLLENGFDDIIITTRYRSGDVEDFIADYGANNASVRCVEELTPLGTAGSVKNAAKNWDEPFLVISGDCMTDLRLSQLMLYHKSMRSDATIVAVRVDDPGEYGTLGINSAGAVESLCEKPDWSHTASHFANTGIYVLDPSVLTMIPDNARYDFSLELFPEMIRQGKRVFGYKSTSYWCDIGDFSALRGCVRDLLSFKTEIKLPESKNGIFAPFGAPEGNYAVNAPVYFGKNVTVGENSVIGPFTVLEDNVSVEDSSRIKRSVVESGTCVETGSDLIGSIIGKGCVIKSGSICLEGSVIGDDCTVDSGSTVSNNVLVWPGKHIPYRSVLTDNLRDGGSGEELICEEGICGSAFSQLTSEKCCKIGQALASLSCAGRLAVGYGMSNASKALAMAVLSGLISAGSVIYDFGECFESQMRFFVSFCSLDCGIFIDESKGRARLRLFGEHGMPLLRKYERELESRYKRSDFRRSTGAAAAKIRDMSAVAQIYEGELLTLAGARVKGMSADITSTNALIAHTAEKCMCLLGMQKRESPSFCVDDSGTKVSARDENGSLVTHARLLTLAASNAIALGRDIIVPFSAPACIDSLADNAHRAVVRVGVSPMNAVSERAASLLSDCFWAFDALSLSFTVASIMKEQKKTLSRLIAELPQFSVCERVVASRVQPSLLASVLGVSVKQDDQGLRKTDGDASVAVMKTGAGRLIKIMAEAPTMEAARELCAETERKITNDIDIFGR